MLEIKNEEMSRAPAQANRTSLSSPAPSRHWFRTGTAQALGALPLGALLLKTLQFYTDMTEITEPFSREVCPSVPPVKWWEKLCKAPHRRLQIHSKNNPCSDSSSSRSHISLPISTPPRLQTLQNRKPPCPRACRDEGQHELYKSSCLFLTFRENLGEGTCSSFQNPKPQQHISAFPPPPQRAHCRHNALRSRIALRHLERLSPQLHFFRIPAQSRPVPGHPTILPSLGSGQGDVQKRLGLAFWGTPNFHRTCSALIID